MNATKLNKLAKKYGRPTDTGMSRQQLAKTLLARKHAAQDATTDALGKVAGLAFAFAVIGSTTWLALTIFGI